MDHEFCKKLTAEKKSITLNNLKQYSTTFNNIQPPSTQSTTFNNIQPPSTTFNQSFNNEIPNNHPTHRPSQYCRLPVFTLVDHCNCCLYCGNSYTTKTTCFFYSRVHCIVYRLGIVSLVYQQ